MINLIVGTLVAFATSFIAVFVTVRLANRPLTRGASVGTPLERLASAVLHSGGVLLLISVVVAYSAQVIVSGESIAPSGLVLMLLLSGFTMLGVTLDFFERRGISTPRRRRLLKFGGQGALALGFGFVALNFPNSHGRTPASGHLSFVTDLNFDLLAFGILGVALAVIWIGLIVAGGAFVVSLIEGYDGLAAGLATIALTAYIFVAAWQTNESCLNLRLAHANLHKCYQISDPETLAVMSSILVASLIAFIWWNTHPAQVQLGESGSFFLGSAIAALAVMTHTELLLICLTILFGGFARIALPPKSHRTAARRWPLPAQPSTRGRLQIAGASEVTIVVRFWIVAGLLSGVGIALFYGIWAAK